MAEVDGLAAPLADGAALGDPDPLGDPGPLAPADPLGTGVMLGVGLGVGEGKSELGMFANDRANISTKMAITIRTQMRARLSFRGGSEPR